MATIIAWVIKFFSGFAIWKGQQFGKILFYSIISLGVLFAVGVPIYKTFEKKVSNLEKYYNCNITQVHPVECPKEPAFTLIKLWRLRLFSVR
jgi:hypothetical protein